MRQCPVCSASDSVYLTGWLKGNDYHEVACNKCSYKEWVHVNDLTPEEKAEWQAKQSAKRAGGSRVPLQTSLYRAPVPEPTRNDAGARPGTRGRTKPQTRRSLTDSAPSKVLAATVIKKVAVKEDEPDPVAIAVQDTFTKRISRQLPGYIERPGQIELALRMADSLKTGSILVSEVGVGTGKSLAYIGAAMAAVPNINGNGPVVISTKTISLQEQLYRKDLPFAAKIGFNRFIFITKGQSHYLCRLRLHRTKPTPEITDIKRWMAHYGAPDYGDESSMCPMSSVTWDMISVGECLDKDCTFHTEGICGFVEHKKARREQQGVIICNHNLLVDDLLLREKGRGGLWPKPAAIIIDEAHGLESSCRAEMSQEISMRAIEKLTKSLRFNDRIVRVISSLSDKYVYFSDALVSIGHDLEEEVVRYKEASIPDEYGNVYIPNTEEILGQAKRLSEWLSEIHSVLDMAQGFGGLTERDLRSVGRASFKISRTAEKVKSWIDDEDNYYLSAKFTKKDIILTVAPIDVSSFLKKALWSKWIPTILTSGTLAVNESFSLVNDKLGLTGNTRCREFFGSPSLAAGNIAYYIPADLPRPSNDDEQDKEYVYQLAARIVDLLKITSGRALVLFTSYRRMDAVYDLLKDRDDLPWTKLKQGQGSDGQILDQFRGDESSVLFATGAFWEGVDVAGHSLSMVIMDKLPFPYPHDPLVKARTVGDPDGSHFETLFMPEMLLRLKQGTGRLIRTEKDWGIVAILDVRASKEYTGGRRYSAELERTLPAGPVFSEIGQVKAWYQREESRRADQSA